MKKVTSLTKVALTCSIIYFVISTSILYRIDVIISYTNADDYFLGGCPPGHVMLRKDETPTLFHPLGYIPKIVHVIVESKCVTPNVHTALHNKLVPKSSEYILQFHDRDEINSLLVKKRPMFRNLNDVVNCIHKLEYEIDLIKLLLLWDYGGIVADLQFLLSDQHHHDEYGNFFDILHLDHNDEAFFMQNAHDSSFGTYVMGSIKSHPVIYMMIQKFISNLFQQYDDENIYKTDDVYRRNNMIQFPLNRFFPELFDGDYDSIKRSYIGIYNRTVTIFNVTHSDSSDLDYDMLLLFNGILLQQKKDVLPCVNFNPYHDDTMLDLQGIAGSPNIYKCEEPLITFEDRIQEGQHDDHQRKIPKIVHLTSKSRCLTDNYTDNSQTWFFQDHSVILHDDDAVNRIMQRKWKEFPQLQDASKCITSGAGMADVWRYLVLWEYGGIYTDIDNAPGPRLMNGTIIGDEMDAFLEVEVGRFPSQYFMAVSPHHPLTYFAVHVAMQRLYEEQNIVQQYVPYITGPGALKAAMIHTIGNGNPSDGTHIGAYGRNVTMIGDKGTARRREYINRGSVSNWEYSKMNMTHYSIAGRQKGRPRKPCIQVLYEEYLESVEA